jgi:hypothetical protein
LVAKPGVSVEKAQSLVAQLTGVNPTSR